MKETSDPIKTKTDEIMASVQPGPQGVGMAVAFDWGLAVQIIVMPTVSLLLGLPEMFKQFGPVVGTLLSTAVMLPFAALLAIFGEGIRRGWRWTRLVQLIANTLLFLLGLLAIPSAWNGARQGNYWPIVTEVILLIFSPLIAWRMAGKRSKRWYDTVSSATARKRHGGTWPFLIAIWAAVGGILQAIAALNR
ncbi:MAG: hypothetical protein NVS4B11_25070 [Ktedonobacteraceae bacterium]